MWSHRFQTSGFISGAEHRSWKRTTTKSILTRERRSHKCLRPESLLDSIPLWDILSRRRTPFLLLFAGSHSLAAGSALSRFRCRCQSSLRPNQHLTDMQNKSFPSPPSPTENSSKTSLQNWKCPTESSQEAFKRGDPILTPFRQYPRLPGDCHTAASV